MSQARETSSRMGGSLSVIRNTRRRTRAASPFTTPESVRSRYVYSFGNAAPRLSYAQTSSCTRCGRPCGTLSAGPPATPGGRSPQAGGAKTSWKYPANCAPFLNVKRPGGSRPRASIGHHLRVLHFPADVQAALTSGHVNFQEAAQLARHMFWDEMKRLFFAMREIQLEDLDEQTLSDFMAAVDKVSNVLYRIEASCRKREQPHNKIGVK